MKNNNVLMDYRYSLSVRASNFGWTGFLSKRVEGLSGASGWMWVNTAT